MLKTQEYLLSGKTFEDLNNELGIEVSLHPELPLAILNYNQIDSPKTHPIVRECRALVLNTETKDLISGSMLRFYNMGEVADEFELFNFNNFFTFDKEDGSLLKIFNFENNWIAHTRGSFNMDLLINKSPYTWKEVINQALKVNHWNDLNLFKNITYVCELCSPWNKVVRRYDTPTVYLLTAFDGNIELHPEEVDKICNNNHFVRVGRHNFRSIDEIINHIAKCELNDPTYEGVVICDDNFRRWKIKSKTYLALHRSKNNGQLRSEDVIDMLLRCEDDEYLSIFPELSYWFEKYRPFINEEYQKLMKLWNEVKDIESQKDFALAIVNKSKFSSVLFSARKENCHPKKIWTKSAALIAKTIE